MRYIDKGKYFEAIQYQPHSRQRLYHNSQARFRIPVCGRRFGKSLMAGRDTEPLLLLPDKRVWIVGPTYDLGEKEFRVIWNDLIVKRGFGKDKNVKRSYNVRAGEMYIEFPSSYPNAGTKLEVRSAMHPEKLVGEALDKAVMSEAAKHTPTTWNQYIRPSLSDRHGSADFPTTPEGFNWLYELWQLGQNQDPAYAEYESWQFPSWENNAIFPGGEDDPEIKLLRLTMDVESFDQEIGASFAATVGRIYSEFNESDHVRNLGFNPLWPNYMAFDFGFTNPLAAIEFQVDPWDNIYIWREHYKSFLMLQQHLEELKARDQPDGYHLDMTFGDAADPEGTLFVNMHFAPCLSMPESKVNWREGINLVKRFLKRYETGVTDEFGTPELAPKLFVDPSCKNTIHEFNTYKRKDTETNTTEHNAQGAAVKQNDHALDAIRYGLMHIFVLGAQHHLADVADVNPTLNPVHKSPTEVAVDIELAAKQFQSDLDADPDWGGNLFHEDMVF